MYIICRDGGRPSMRTRKCCWSSASTTIAFFPLIHDVLMDGRDFFHGGRVGNARRSASFSLTLVYWHRVLSLTETGRWTAVWRWWCCQMILLAVLPRCAFRAVFIPLDKSRASRRCCSGGMLASTSILAPRVQRRAPRHILTHSFCKTSNLLNVGPDPYPYTGEP